MRQNEKITLLNLLNNQKVSSLSILIDSKPYVSLLPYVVKTDYKGAFVHASNMARHVKGMYSNATFSLLINMPDTAETNTFALPRVSFQGTVQPLGKNSEHYNDAKNIYLKKYPDSTELFSFEDFNLYELIFDEARYVANFGRVFNLNKESIKDLGLS